MSILKAVLLGLIQGVTEFLPVSSSGHLAIFGGSEESFGLELIVLFHFGTLLSILAYYRRDVISASAGGLRLIAAFYRAVRRREKLTEYLATDAGARLALLIAVGTIPTGIIGLGLKDLADYTALHVRFVGAFFIITGILLFLCDRFPIGAKGVGQGTLRDAVTIGIFQGLAVLPGLSRSGFTVFAAVMRGFERHDAARLSFLLSIPALLGAAVLELRHGVPSVALAPALAGSAVAFVSGYISIAILIRVLASRKLQYFAGYLLAMGLLVIVFAR